MWRYNSYLKNHGIPKETVDNVFAESAAFFRRPKEQKEELAWVRPAFHLCAIPGP